MINYEDAMKSLIDWLKKGCPSDGHHSYGYDVYLTHIIKKSSTDFHEQKTNSPMFFDAAWELCRRGILRPGIKTTGAQATEEGNAGVGYCITPFGKKWLEEDEDIFIPTEPERFAQMLEPYKKTFGPGYHERAQQAIRCYGAHAYLACCSMCGAAAESILLATAIKKTNDEVRKPD